MVEGGFDLDPDPTQALVEQLSEYLELYGEWITRAESGQSKTD